MLCGAQAARDKFYIRIPFSVGMVSVNQNDQNILAYAGIFQHVNLSGVEAVRKKARIDWEQRQALPRASPKVLNKP